MTRGELEKHLECVIAAFVDRFRTNGCEIPVFSRRTLVKELLAALDKEGLAVVPVEPNKVIDHAMAKAMSPGRRPTPERVSCRDKHRIRYRAAVDAGRIDKEPEGGAH